MDNYTLNDLQVMANAKNYVDWQFSEIKPFIGNKILEVGSGIGTFTELFLKNASSVLAIEIDKYCANILNSKFSSQKKLNVICGDILDESVWNQLADKNIDTIVCINVLEHIKDDQQAIELFYNLLKENGTLILLVPSHQWLYGTIDKVLGHYRRYSKRDLLHKVQKQGFEIKKNVFFNMAGIAGWFWNNKITKRAEESVSQIGFYDKKIVPVQRTLEKFMPLKTGLSLICIAEKKIGK